MEADEFGHAANFFELPDKLWNVPVLREAATSPHNTTRATDVEFNLNLPRLGPRTLIMKAVPLKPESQCPHRDTIEPWSCLIPLPSPFRKTRRLKHVLFHFSTINYTNTEWAKILRREELYQEIKRLGGIGVSTHALGCLYLIPIGWHSNAGWVLCW